MAIAVDIAGKRTFLTADLLSAILDHAAQNYQHGRATRALSTLAAKSANRSELELFDAIASFTTAVVEDRLISALVQLPKTSLQQTKDQAMEMAAADGCAVDVWLNTVTGQFEALSYADFRATYVRGVSDERLHIGMAFPEQRPIFIDDKGVRSSGPVVPAGFTFDRPS
jgi:hypothetical protein